MSPSVKTMVKRVYMNIQACLFFQHVSHLCFGVGHRGLIWVVVSRARFPLLYPYT